jgi:hypothetical protein
MAFETEIADLEKLLDAATSSVLIDGVRTDFDLETARKRLAELKRKSAGTSWPRTSTVLLSSVFAD